MRGGRAARGRALAALTCCGLFGWAPRARALELGLQIDGCADLPEKRVEQLLELELSAGVARRAAAERLAAVVSVACAGSEVEIRVADATTNKVVARSFTSPTCEHAPWRSPRRSS